MITITREDNMALMARYPDKFFNLTIVDPPYGINAANMAMGTNLNRKGNGQYAGESTATKLRKGRLNSGGCKLKDRFLNKSSFNWDNEPPPKEYFQELFRVSQNQIIWGGNYFDLPPTRCVLCWDKVQAWENFSQWEMAWTSFDKPAALFSFANRGGANKETKIHPTQKPVDLYKWILSKYAKPGDKILDTHLGSGSIAIACHDYGYDLTACELDEGYYTSAMKRLNNHQSQVKIDF